MDKKKYDEVVMSAQNLLNRDPVKNKAAFLFQAQAQVELNFIQEAQGALNQLY